MSKTDKTRPFRVQVAEKPFAWHDHSEGPCDLIPVRQWVKTNKTRKSRNERHHCQWQVRNWHTDVTFSNNDGDKWWKRINKENRIMSTRDAIAEGLAELSESEEADRREQAEEDARWQWFYAAWEEQQWARYQEEWDRMKDNDYENEEY